MEGQEWEKVISHTSQAAYRDLLSEDLRNFEGGHEKEMGKKAARVFWAVHHC